MARVLASVGYRHQVSAPRSRGGAAVALAFVYACSSNAPSPDSAPRLLKRIAKDAKVHFTFFNRLAQMRTVERADDVDPDARRAVMVSMPKQSLSGDRIYVSDLTRPAKDGSYELWVEERGQWLDRVMPRASVMPEPPPQPAKPARTKRRRPRKRPAKVAAAGKGAAPAAAAQQAPVQVAMFSTTWCPSCKKARAYFDQRGVKYVDFDVERNQEAAKKMVEIQQAQGLQRGAVPLIVVGNRVYQGFSPMQMDTALAQLNQQQPAGAGG